MPINKGLVGAAIVIVIVIAAAAVFLGSGAKQNPGMTTSITQTVSHTSSTFAAPVMITDPAQVPAGTTALIFAYSNVQVNATGASGSQWINATGSGSVNLISIMNSTQVMGYANLTANTSITQVRMLVNLVNITINGTTYGVPVTNPQLTLSISGDASASKGFGVLIDYAPTVSPYFVANTTVFNRVPAGKAVVTGGISASAATNVGLVSPISASARASLAAVSPTISIASAQLSSSGNTTQLSVTVKNEGNQSTSIKNVVVYGSQTVGLSSSAGGTLGLNGTALILHPNATLSTFIKFNIGSFAMQNFAANANGNLTFVRNVASAQTSGVALGADSNATLTYGGVASYNFKTFQTTPTSGAQYRVVVVTTTGESASTTVTAS
ncbi:MAG TPA: hypothetical protein VND15_00625 [Candidatus Acidoferrales bacterium]|nr:hypothetical protein [Candidatus Acidoferrales bacterium]